MGSALTLENDAFLKAVAETSERLGKAMDAVIGIVPSHAETFIVKVWRKMPGRNDLQFTTASGGFTEDELGETIRHVAPGAHAFRRIAENWVYVDPKTLR
jgi:hypothetical protein